ncbi:MAG: ubiquinol-cytochrome C chaperone family protein [Pseudomonadota bacterium]
MIAEPVIKIFRRLVLNVSLFNSISPVNRHCIRYLTLRLAKPASTRMQQVNQTVAHPMDQTAPKIWQQRHIMIFAHFSRKRKNREIVDGLYRQLTALARDPVYYADMRVPDTVMGRFEMMTLTIVLFLRRTHESNPVIKQLAQDLVDTFFEDMDHSLRELGVGDVSVPKRMKKLARMFYGRAQTYGNALNDRDGDELAECLYRNLYPSDRTDTDTEASDLRDLADTTLDLEVAFKSLADDDLLAGKISLGAEHKQQQSND